jgi:hypothetical protein
MQFAARSPLVQRFDILQGVMKSMATRVDLILR